jgi:alpha-ketoglutarate-dependent taurine dioxygenase
MVMWDNRCTLHCAVSDYDDSERRHLNRVTVTAH